MNLIMINFLLEILNKERRETYCDLFQSLWDLNDYCLHEADPTYKKACVYNLITLNNKKRLEKRLRTINECIKYIKRG